MFIIRVLGRADNKAVLTVPSLVTARTGERHGTWGENEPHRDTYLPSSLELELPPRSQYDCRPPH